MGAITLRNALSVLAKSSSFSVTTVTYRQKDEFDQLKEQLFVKQEIETELQRYLEIAKLWRNHFCAVVAGMGSPKF